MSTVEKKGESDSSQQKGKASPPKAGGSSSNPVESAKSYFQGVKSEWGKINWPTWPQIWGQTLVVLVMVILISIGLFAIDYAFHYIITFITPRV
jgi:preprotein translocase SecE subunit